MAEFSKLLHLCEQCANNTGHAFSMLRQVPDANNNATQALRSDERPRCSAHSTAQIITPNATRSANNGPHNSISCGADISRENITLAGHASNKDRQKFTQTDFARQLAQTPRSIGAIAPSSKLLARKLIHCAPLTNANVVVELGPGTGVFTEEIKNNLNPDSLFFALEINAAFAKATRERCTDVPVYHDAASSLPDRLKQHRKTHADCIISSLPWTILDAGQQDEILNAVTDSLEPGGVFISIVYLGARFRSRGRYFISSLEQHFSSVTTTPTIWQNLPPTQIYHCVK